MSINSSSSKIVSEVSATLDVTSITRTSCIRLVMITCLLQVRFTIRRLADTLCLLTIVLVRPEGDCVVFILETDVCPSFSTLTSDLSLLMTAVTFTWLCLDGDCSLDTYPDSIMVKNHYNIYHQLCLCLLSWLRKDNIHKQLYFNISLKSVSIYWF